MSMKMKKYIYAFAALSAGLALGSACTEQRNFYEAGEYVMFADTLNVYPVQQDV